MAELAATLADAAQLAQPLAARIAYLAEARWDDWAALARAWAELTALRYGETFEVSGQPQVGTTSKVYKLEATLY
jgi:hypothetical protein